MAFIFGSDIYSMNPDGDVKELTNLGPDGALPFSSRRLMGVNHLGNIVR
jgi:hypothetical protein